MKLGKYSIYFFICFFFILKQYFSETISNIKIEMEYIQKGSRNPKMNENGIQDISTSYLEIPLSINYNQSDLLTIETC